MKQITTKALNNAIEEAIKNAKVLDRGFRDVLDTVSKSAETIKKGIAEVDFSNARNIEKVNSAFEESNKLVEQKIIADRELIKGQSQQNKVQKELQKNLQEEEKTRQQSLKTIQQEEKNRQELLKTQIVQRRATIQEQKEQERLEKLRLKQIAAAKKENDAYKQLARQRTLAQNSFKALAAEFGENSTQAQEALSVFNQLDESFTAINKAAKDGHPFVGRYADAIEEAGIDGQKTNKILVDLKKEQLELNKVIAVQTKLFGKNSAQVKESQDQLKKLDDTIDDIAKSSSKTADEVSNLNKAFKAFASATIVLKAIELIGDLFTSSDSGAAGLQKTLGRLTISISVFIDRVVRGFSFFQNQFLSAINTVKLGFFEFLDSLNTQPINIGGVQVFSGQVVNVTGKLAELRAEQAELGKNTDTLSSIFSGFTDEINKKVEANDKAIDQEFRNIRQNAILRKSVAELAKELEGLARIYDDDSQSLLDREEALDQSIKKQQELNALNLQIARNEENLARLRARASTDSSQAQADLQDAISARIEAETQGLTELNNLRREQNSIRRDIRDLELDFLIDDAENRRQINDRIIANEEETQRRRKVLLEENKRIIEDSFSGQAQAVNKELSDLGKSAIDFNELLKLPTEGLIDFLEPKVGETLAIRILEIIKERRTALQDIADTQKELAESDREIVKTTADIILQEEALKKLREEGADSEKILADLENDRLQQKKLNLQAEIDLLSDGSKTKLELEQELNELLLQEEAKRAAKEKEIADKELEEAKRRREELTNFVREQSVAAASAVINGLISESEAEQDRIQESIDQAQQRNSELLSLSASADSQVSQLAADSLAQQRAIEREKTQALEEEKRKQVRLETVLAGLQAYGANAGQPNAAGKTIADIGVLLAGLTASAGSFYDGTDRLLSSGKGIDNKGGMLNINHPDEMIIQEKLVKQMGYPSRYDVADVFTRYKDGDLIDKQGASATLQQVIVNNNNEEITGEIRALRKEIRKSTDPKVLVDVAKGLIKIRERKGNRVNVYID